MYKSISSETSKLLAKETALRTRKSIIPPIPVDEDWEVCDPAFFADDSDAEILIVVGERKVRKGPTIVEEDTSDCSICMESFPVGSFLQESLTPLRDARKEDHKFCITCLEENIRN